jgi:phage terminase small subunit
MTKRKRTVELFNSSPVRVKPLTVRLNTPVDPLEDQKRTVTAQHWKFIQTLVDGEGKVTLKDAAIAAGYSPASARETAYQLTNPKSHPHVVAAIQRYRQDLAEKYGTTFERHMRDMQNIRDRALEAGNYSAAVQAEYRRGQALGTIYVERKEIRHGTIDSMSLDEVKRKLEEIKSIYGDPAAIIDVTPAAEALIEEDAEYVDDDEDAEDEQPVVCEEPDEEEEEEPEEDEGSLMIKKMREEQVRMAEEKRTKMRNRHLP